MLQMMGLKPELSDLPSLMVTVLQSQTLHSQSLFPLLVTPGGPGLLRGVILPLISRSPSQLFDLVTTLGQALSPFGSPQVGLACKMQSDK